MRIRAKTLGAFHLRRQPGHDDRNYIRDFLIVQFAADGNAVPFCQTGATTGGGGMLRDKNRMAAPGSLPAVIGRSCRREALADKVNSMALDDRRAAARKIIPFRNGEAKARTKG